VAPSTPESRETAWAGSAVRTDTRLRTVDDFRRIPIAQIRGFTVRLGDLATVELGVEDDTLDVTLSLPRWM